MKYLLTLGSVLFINMVSSAQLNGNISDLKIYKDSVQYLNFNNQFVLNTAENKFLFENKIGKVFQSPIDRMRILAPDFHSNMPIAGNILINPERIPNALSGKTYIPPPLNKKKFQYQFHFNQKDKQLKQDQQSNK